MTDNKVPTCGDCIHADVCARVPYFTEFSRDNPAYCKDFAADNNVGRWIPVTERLPDLELVDVKTYDMDLFPCLVCKNMLNPQRKNIVTKAWYDGEGFMDSDCIIITKFVTHWMPLPEAPEED